MFQRNFLESQVVDSALPMQQMQIQSLVGELRSHIPAANKPKYKTEAKL